MKKIKAATFFLIVVIALFFGGNLLKRGWRIDEEYRYNSVLKDISEWDAKEQTGYRKKIASFSEKGIENIALVTMVKDEEDIIYENLVWHFCVGFRKFVIVDNNSTDKTLSLIHKFKKETEGKAIVIIMEDPIREYIQSRIISAGLKTVNAIWPEVEWVFPLDADEFVYTNRQLDKILVEVPNNKDALVICRYEYFPTNSAVTISDFPGKFYDNIKYRGAFLKHVDLQFSQDSKFAIKITKWDMNSPNCFFNSLDIYKYNLSFMPGNPLGIDIMHFPKRSPLQVKKKYINAGASNGALRFKNRSEVYKYQWNDSFIDSCRNKGIEEAAVGKFNENVKNEKDLILDKIYILDAIAMFNKLLKSEVNDRKDDDICLNCELKIPKIFHRIWNVWDKQNPGIPEGYKRFDRNLRKSHPDWVFIEWDDKKIESFIKEHYPGFLTTYMSYDKGVKKNDAARYLIVKHYGGVFIQYAINISKNIEPLLRGYDAVFTRGSEDYGLISNAFFASIPEHKMFQDIDLALQNSFNLEIIQSTGPDFLRAVLADYIRKNGEDGIRILPRKYILPFNYIERFYEPIYSDCILRDQECLKHFPDAYGYCIWRGAWIDFKR